MPARSKGENAFLATNQQLITGSDAILINEIAKNLHKTPVYKVYGFPGVLNYL
ncbi:hypothetical protein ['Camptotheca acuminata' phytoplasma]|uniref:hypothetical protein n=1 Tax='Camptotheca acuminata' phytoplasma TaxID=3239192 RepID=UPI00351A0B35